MFTRKRLILLSFITGALFEFCYPPFKTGFFSYIGLWPLFYICFFTNRPYLYGYIWAFGFSIAQMYWLVNATIIGTIGAVPAIAAFYLIPVWFLRFGYKRIGELVLIILPFFWASFEYLHSLGELGFPWGTIAYTQTYYLPLIQYASITGAYGVSFWVAVLNVTAWFFFRRFSVKKDRLVIGAFIVILFAVPFIHGTTEMSKNVEDHEKIKVSILQPNVGTDVKWTLAYQDTNFINLIEMSKKAEEEKPGIIIWPETATSNKLRYYTHYLKALRDFTNTYKTSILTGVIDVIMVKNERRNMNSAFLFQPGMPHFQSYDKLRLVPYSESVPFRNMFPFLKKTAFGESADFYPGRKHTVLKFRLFDNDKQGRIISTASLICWDSVFGDDVRIFVKNGTEFLSIITNDSWFGRSPAPYHHAQIAVFRAIENRIGVARSANSGVSLFIDPYGRKYNETGIFEKRNISNYVYLKKGHTFYTEYGDVFTYGYIVISLFFIVFLLFLKKTFKNEFPENIDI